MRTKDTIKLSVRVEIVNVDIKNDNVEIAVEIQKNGFIETQSKDNIFYNFKNP